MTKKNFKKTKWLWQLLACLLVMAMAPVPLPAYAAGGAGINTVVSGASSTGISVDSDGNLYYMSSVDPTLNSRYINKMSPDGDVTRMAGGGTLAGGGMADGVDADKAIICNPWKTVLYGGELYFSDTDSMRIRKISGGKVYNVIGDGASYSDPDGALTSLTRICNPRGMAFDESGNLYFAEAGGYRVRVVSADRSTIETVAGNGTRGFSGNGGPASAAEFEIPSGIALDASGNLYIADPGNHVIWEVAAESHTQYGIDMQAGYIYIVAGGGDVSGEGIQANGARMYWPRDVIVDDSGNLYIAELHRMRKIGTDGVIRTIAGQTESGNSGDGEDASEALFNNPLGMALDSDGNLFVADTGNEKIRKIILSAPASNLTITTDSLPGGVVGTTYRAQLAASGGTGNYTWSATGLPVGMRITLSGRLCGMPAGSGNYSARITVTDSDGAAVTKVLTLTTVLAQDSPLDHWTERREPASMEEIQIYDMAYDGSAFEGVGNTDGTMTSPDGEAWSVDADYTPAQAYRGVAYGEGTFVAVGRKMDFGIIITKIAGSGFGEWADKTPTDSGTLESVAYAGNSTFIAVGENTVLISKDLGTTWRAPTFDSDITFTLHGVATDGNSHAVAVGEASNGQSILWHSADGGNTWSATASHIEGTGLNSVAYGGDNVFVAVGNDGIAYRSVDGGSTWEVSELPGSLDDVTPVMRKIAFGENTFVAVGQCEDGQYNVISSIDNGVTWTGRVSMPDLSFQAIAYGNNSFVKAGYTATESTGKLYQSAPLTPVSGSVLVTSITVTGTGGATGVQAGSTLQMLTAVSPADAADKNVTWSISGSGASISPSGLLTGTTAGSVTIRATAKDGSGVYGERVITVTAAPVTAHTVTASATPSAPRYEASVTGGSGSTKTEVKVNTSNASAELTSAQAASGKEIVVNMPKIAGVTNYTLGIPVPDLSKDSRKGSIMLNTDAGNITLPSDMLAGTSAASGSKAQVTIGTVKPGDLPKAAQDKVGNRPIVSLSLSVDGKTTEWNNPNAPVTVSIPYTPTAEELKNPEGIIVWYIDGSGKLTEMSDAKYDPVTKSIVFTTTHFSFYAVGYKAGIPVSVVKFADVLPGVWYYDAITFIANKGITSGTGEDKFSPDATLTRGQFIVMLMRAYGIEADANPADNFSDAGNTYYTNYLAAAKRLGISAGVGNNMFAPGKEITRQEMFTLLYNALKVIGKLPQGSSIKTLSNFTDAGQIDAWAKEAMTLLVETGTIGGNAGKLAPLGTTTRAEMAQVLYNLLGK